MGRIPLLVVILTCLHMTPAPDPAQYAAKLIHRINQRNMDLDDLASEYNARIRAYFQASVVVDVRRDAADRTRYKEQAVEALRLSSKMHLKQSQDLSRLADLASTLLD